MQQTNTRGGQPEATRAAETARTILLQQDSRKPSLTIRYADARGLDCLLTVTSETTNAELEALLVMANAASVSITEAGGAPLSYRSVSAPVSAPAPAKAEAEAEDTEDTVSEDAAPVCPVHGAPLISSKWHGGYYCPAEATDAANDNGKGYCNWAATEDGRLYQERGKTARGKAGKPAPRAKAR